MNDQHVSAVCAIWQTILLALNAILIGWYLLETRGIRRSSQRQVEASFRPAVMVKHDGSTTSLPELENIGNGPAMDVNWTLRNSKLKHTFGYLRPNQKQPLFQVKELYNAGMQSGCAVMDCNYRSISGWKYSSTITCDLNTIEFETMFHDE